MSNVSASLLFAIRFNASSLAFSLLSIFARLSILLFGTALNFPSHNISVIIHSLHLSDINSHTFISSSFKGLVSYHSGVTLHSFLLPNPSIFIAVSPVGNCSTCNPSCAVFDISSRIIRK